MNFSTSTSIFIHTSHHSLSFSFRRLYGQEEFVIESETSLPQLLIPFEYFIKHIRNAVNFIATGWCFVSFPF